MPQPTLRTPGPDDAAAWFDFLVTQQAAAYTGVVPADFAARQAGLGRGPHRQVHRPWCEP